MKLRILIADDERPARMFLQNLLASFDDAEVVAAAENGAQAVELIAATKPDLAILDLQMPELGGLQAARILRGTNAPLIAFATAHDEFAVQAFEVNAIDYLLKPIEKSRLRQTLDRAIERLEQASARESDYLPPNAANENAARQPPLERIPVKLRDEIVLLPAREIVSIVADGELLHLTSVSNERYTINFRLKDLEARLDNKKFVRLSRGALVNVEFIRRVAPLPGGTYLITLKNNQQLQASRVQSRALREQLLKL